MKQLLLIQQALSFEGKCNRLEFWLTNVPCLLYGGLLYYLAINDMTLPFPPIFFFVYLIIGCLLFILFFSSLVRRATDAEFSERAMVWYFIVPVAWVFYPVIAGLIATPFAIVNPSLGLIVMNLLTSLTLPVQILLGAFAWLFQLNLLFVDKALFMREEFKK